MAGRRAPKRQDTGSFFAPLPNRAIGWGLSGVELHTLACVARYDQMSAINGGQGCYASNRTMADLIGCNYSVLCATLSNLVKKGFLVKEKAGRRTAYRVIYTSDDRLPGDNISADKKGCPPPSRRDGIGCLSYQLTPGKQAEKPAEDISLRLGRYDAEALERYPAEAARLAARGGQETNEKANVGAYLAQVERTFRRCRNRVPLVEWNGHLDRLLKLAIEPAEDRSIQGRASRLYEEIGGWVDEQSGDAGEPAYPDFASLARSDFDRRQG